MLLIDSSAIVRYMLKEPGWESIEEYVGRALTISLAGVEIISAISKRIAKNEIDSSVAMDLVGTYMNAAILLDQTKHLLPALRISMENGTTVYDSLFIATALAEGCELVSCDEKQLKVAKKLGLVTYGGS